MDLLSKSLDLNLTTGYCDLENMNIDSNMVPEGSIIFTSYSLHYTSNLSIKLIDRINRLKPKVVIHFEPIYELFSENTIHNLMCRKYFEANGCDCVSPNQFQMGTKSHPRNPQAPPGTHRAHATVSEISSSASPPSAVWFLFPPP